MMLLRFLEGLAYRFASCVPTLATSQKKNALNQRIVKFCRDWVKFRTYHPDSMDGLRLDGDPPERRERDFEHIPADGEIQWQDNNFHLTVGNSTVMTAF